MPVFKKWMIALLSTVSLTSFAGEVDVVNATVKATGENTYRFSATLKHEDTGWDHYANKWEVRGKDGTVYGTRILHHPHVNEQPFTRSLSGVKIPADIETVIIRAYDSVHDSGGKEFTLKLPK